jgi:predicted nucleic acid-binding Zn ribbon protein
MSDLINKRFKTGAQVLKSLLENGDSPLSTQFLRWKLWKRWEDYVGTSISQVCEPVGYYRGELVIWVKNSSWIHQLTFMKDPILKKINQRLGIHYVHSIRFTLDRREVPATADEVTELKASMDALLKDED